MFVYISRRIVIYPWIQIELFISVAQVGIVGICARFAAWGGLSSFVNGETGDLLCSIVADEQGSHQRVFRVVAFRLFVLRNGASDANHAVEDQLRKMSDCFSAKIRFRVERTSLAVENEIPFPFLRDAQLAYVRHICILVFFVPFPNQPISNVFWRLEISASSGFAGPREILPDWIVFFCPKKSVNRNEPRRLVRMVLLPVFRHWSWANLHEIALYQAVLASPSSHSWINSPNVRQFIDRMDRIHLRPWACGRRAQSLPARHQLWYSGACYEPSQECSSIRRRSRLCCRNLKLVTGWMICSIFQSIFQRKFHLNRTPWLLQATWFGHIPQ